MSGHFFTGFLYFTSSFEKTSPTSSNISFSKLAKPIKVKASPFDQIEKNYPFYLIYVKVSQSLFCLFQDQKR